MKTEVSTVTTKGQLVIPSKLRRKYAIRKGTQVAFVEEENRLVLQPLTPDSFAACAALSNATLPP